MTTQVPPAPTTVYPPRAVIDAMRGAFLARALHAFAELRIAEALAGGPRRCVGLAEELGLDARALHQVLRAVASTGLLRTLPGPDTGPRVTYALTAQGETLREDHPSGARDLVLTLQGPTALSAAAVLTERLTSNRTGPEIATGAPYFDYLREHPDEAAAFDRMMIAVHGAEAEAVAAGYDFGRAETIVDVGGGLGGFLLPILRRFPRLRGTIADLAPVAARAREHLAAHGMDHRCTATPADFFSYLPDAADVYLLSYVLHNWDDDSCVTILRTCATAMTGRSRLLAVETVLPDDDRPHPGKLLDMVMVIMTRGTERTAREYQELAQRAGLHLERIVPTDSPVSILEMTRS